MQDNSDRLVWFLTGAAIGATIALLYAPQSGAETRSYIRKKAREGREVISEKGGELMEKGRELYGRGRRIAEEAAEVFERGKKLVEG